MSVRDEWNWGCEWPQLWQVYGMFGSELTALSAPKVLGTSPEMTCWAYNILMLHRRDVTGYKRSKVEDARLGRETSVGYAKQNLGVRVLSVIGARSGVAFDQRRIHWVLLEAKRACAVAQSTHWALQCVLRCSG